QLAPSELISDAPHGLDLRVGSGKLVAQLLHMDVNGPRLARIREPPYLFEEPVSGEHDPRLPAEGLEELELLCPEAPLAVRDVDLVTRGVHSNVADLQGAAASRHT